MLVLSLSFAEMSKMQHHLLVLVLVGVAPAYSFWNNQATSAATTCPCGQMPQGRIVGGRESRANSYPFMAALTLGDRQPFCGATIITRMHAITASHCTAEIKKSQKFLLVGAHDIRRAISDQFIPVARTIEHPNYDAEDNEANDIAIVVLTRQLIFRNDVGPICMPTRKINLENRFVQALGWGLTRHEGKPSKVLREVVLRIIPWAECQTAYPDELRNDKSQMCTYMEGQDTCQGDSGGPLVVIDAITNRYTIAAIVSYGKDCASQSPAVNTDIAHYLDWIRTVVRDSTNGAMQTCSRAF